jgi:predicted CXXCH cytochrome family protein
MRQKTTFALMFLLVILLVMAVFSLENQPHAFKECLSCHVSDNPAGPMARRMTAPITMLCDTCHEKIISEGYMHPVDVRPQRVAIPADMPLSLTGEITCGTCHDIHSDYFTPYGAPSHFLRRQETGKAFCRICHKDLNALSGGHEASLGEAHFRSQYVVTASSQEIDPMSKNCISCHDGAFAASATIMAGAWTHEQSFLSHDRGSHPIGMNYEAARINRGRKTDLKPLSAVDRRIRFFDGKVGCGSCHDPYSTIRKRLVMSDDNSKLCYSCHIV